MTKKWIVLLIILLLLSVAIFMFYKNFIVEETGNAFYTDGPGEFIGKDYIDGEVFIIKKGDAEFNR